MTLTDIDHWVVLSEAGWQMLLRLRIRDDGCLAEPRIRLPPSIVISEGRGDVLGAAIVEGGTVQEGEVGDATGAIARLEDLVQLSERDLHAVLMV